MQALHPNISKYGEHLILKWRAEFFYNCTNLMPIGQSCLLSAIHATSILVSILYVTIGAFHWPLALWMTRFAMNLSSVNMHL
jgi:hypothetical protein